MNYYELFGVNINATKEQLKIRHRVLVKKYHPDLQQDVNLKIQYENKLKEINMIYDVLIDDNKRSQYNAKNYITIQTNINQKQYTNTKYNNTQSQQGGLTRVYTQYQKDYYNAFSKEFIRQQEEIKKEKERIKKYQDEANQYKKNINQIKDKLNEIKKDKNIFHILNNYIKKIMLEKELSKYNVNCDLCKYRNDITQEMINNGYGDIYYCKKRVYFGTNPYCKFYVKENT